jgi:hypothetical protein
MDAGILGNDVIKRWALDADGYSGAITNAAFTHVLGRVLHRPTVAAVPAAVLRTVLGEMGEETVLAGASVVPRALLDAGFRFRWPGLEDAIRFCLGKVRSKRRPRLAPSSWTVSIGMRPRYSTRSATSAAVEAAIDPLTTSPLGVRAR